MLPRDDLAADKVLAMSGRGEPRDCLDVFALLGLCGDEELFALASRKDSGLAVGTFVESLGAIQRLGPPDWEDAGISAGQASRVRDVISGGVPVS